MRFGTQVVVMVVMANGPALWACHYVKTFTFRPQNICEDGFYNFTNSRQETEAQRSQGTCLEKHR
jgi:hypothetical protein